MKCSGYQKKSGEAYPCGKCIGCRVNKRRDWQARLLFESMACPDVVWTTLTYTKELEPRQLEKSHLERFIKRLRRSSKHERPVRFFAVGEYRPDTFAPHFHLIIWNHKIDLRFNAKNGRWYDPVIETAWSFGGTHAEPLFSSERHAINRCNYVLAYLLEKIEEVTAQWPKEMQREYRTMSRHPAIGMSAMPQLLDLLQTRKGLYLLSSYGTVPTQFRFGSRLYPIPKLLRKKLATILGLNCFTPVKLQCDSRIGITSSGEIALEKTAEQKVADAPATQKFKDWQDSVAKTKAKRKHRKEAAAIATDRYNNWVGLKDPTKTPKTSTAQGDEKDEAPQSQNTSTRSED